MLIFFIRIVLLFFFFFFFFNDTATTEIYTLSLHDALPICLWLTDGLRADAAGKGDPGTGEEKSFVLRQIRSEEHTSELQSHLNLVCRLLLEKKKSIYNLLFLTR